MRKQPRQQRFQYMVEVLVRACGRLIARDGVANLSTHKVAAEAGVSIGSLYQYFADKNGLLDALLDQMLNELKMLVDEHLEQLLKVDVRSAVALLLRAVLALMQRGDKRYLQIARNWQQLQTHRVVDELEKHLLETCRRYLLEHMQALPIKAAYPVLFVSVNSALVTLIGYLSMPNPPVSEDELIGSLANMLDTYLRWAAVER
ncbi:TetR/AcrR family transcriptional regulator [Pseudomonas yamanorum]|uniref:TetR/AcrR family transcriptional regulator n=1 Tax=Pseudomonas yamanorum TaxID=515393 RepID=UPI003F7565B2